MKNLTPNPNKSQFLTIDFYLQCFFFGLLVFFGLLWFYEGSFMIMAYVALLPITVYNSIGLTYHIFKGSYSKKVEMYRKIHASSALIYFIILVFMLYVFEYVVSENIFTFILFWCIPPFFLVAYFFITLQDWKAMKKLNS